MLRRQNYHAPKTENHAPAPSRGFISLSEAAKLCTYSQEYLSLLARRGELRAEKFGNNWFTKTKWLKKYVAKHAEGTILNGKGKFVAEEKAIREVRMVRDFREVGDLLAPIKKKIMAIGAGTAMAILVLVGTVLAQPNLVKDFGTMEIKLTRAGIGEIKNILWDEGAVEFGTEIKKVALGAREDFAGVRDFREVGNLAADPLPNLPLSKGESLRTGGGGTSE